MSASKVFSTQQPHEIPKTQATTHSNPRQLQLNRDLDSNQALGVASQQVRPAPTLFNQNHKQTSASDRMEQKQQASESGASKQPAGRSFRSLIAASNSSKSQQCVSPTSCANERTHDERPSPASGEQLEDKEAELASIAQSDELALEQLSGEQLLEQNKQHVGPVMGIFFKVWSLVKVTRMRHNKMRRQNSEDAGQFHFISGDQLAATSGAQSTATLAAPGSAGSSCAPVQLSQGRHILQDSHFRRAGSQPPATSHSCGQNDFSAHHSHQAYALQQGRLQVRAGSGQQAPQSASTTNSSSSGVSSATSEHEQAALLRRADAASGQRAAPAAKRKDQPAAAAAAAASKGRGGEKSGGHSWTSRIKSRALAGGEQNSQAQLQHHQAPISRYHFRRLDPNLRLQNQTARAVPANLVAGAMQTGKPSRQLRSKSELQQLDELARKRPATPPSSLLMARLRQRQAQRMRSDDYEDEDDARTPEDELAETTVASDEDERDDEEEEDSDLNDIYSTPNDSIQSVPGTQLILEQRRASSIASSQPISQSIVKSFSSQNFSQILRPQLTLTGNSRTIDEQAEQHKSSSSSSSSSKTTTSNNNNNNNNNNASRSNQQCDSIGDGKQLLETTKTRNNRLNGSRFFISSSSSSEDSQPQQANAQMSQANGKIVPQCATPRVSSPQSRQVHIPIHLALHQHQSQHKQADHLVARPNSLLFAPPPQPPQLPPHSQQSQLATPSAVLLSGAGPLASESAIAAMSPMLENSQQSFAANQQILGRNHINQHQAPVQLVPMSSQMKANFSAGYKKSPSLFEMSSNHVSSNTKTRFSSRYPTQANQQNDLSSFLGHQHAQRVAAHDYMREPQPTSRPSHKFQVPHSISLHDCKLTSVKHNDSSTDMVGEQMRDETRPLTEKRSSERSSEYKLAQMLLKLGSNPATARDQDGCTALMHSIMSDNLSAFKCLIEHGVDLNETNLEGLNALDLICSKSPGEIQMEMFNLLIDNHVDFDQTRKSDGTRLLDRLIGVHVPRSNDHNKLPYIDCLLHNGAKLSSSTWLAASGKHELQLRLLRKLCQDGYFLYKKCSIEAAVYRFEYALKRIEELERQLANDCCRSTYARRSTYLLQPDNRANLDSETAQATRQVKYQTYLGLSRCDRKRRFYRRALEFAHMSILVDSTSYEGYYSKAHILKDLGEIDDSLIAIDQTDRLVNKSMEHIKAELSELQNQEESIVFDGCFQVHDPNRAGWIETKRLELIDNLEYLEEAKKHISRLRCEILEDRFKSCSTNADEHHATSVNGIQPVST